MAFPELKSEVENNLLSLAFILLYEGVFVLAPRNEDMEINQTRHVSCKTNGGNYDDFCADRPWWKVMMHASRRIEGVTVSAHRH